MSLKYLDLSIGLQILHHHLVLNILSIEMKALVLTNRHLLVTCSENNLILKSRCNNCIRISHHMLSVCGILTKLFLLSLLHSVSACL